MGEDGWPAWEEGSLNSFAKEVGNCSGFCLGQEADESGCFRAPPAPCFDGEDHEPAPSGTEKFWVCALLGFACVLECCSCVLAGTSSGLAGGSQRRYQGGVDREFAVPPHNRNPLAITSILLSSCRLMWSRVRSLRRVLVVTLAPASRQTLAAALSKGIPRPRETPAWAHAARWSPKWV